MPRSPCAVSEAPLVLVDLLTEEGIAGSAYVFYYTPLAVEPVARLVTNLAAVKIARPAKPDDLLDAAVGAWTARRVAEDNAERLPTNPPIDRRGLKMEIVY